MVRAIAKTGLRERRVLNGTHRPPITKHAFELDRMLSRTAARVMIKRVMALPAKYGDDWRLNGRDTAR